MRRVFSLFAAVLFLLLTVVPASAYEVVDPSEKVYDFTGSLTQEEIDRLAAQARAITDEYGLDIGAAIVESTGSSTAEEYADDFYDYNGFGYGPNDDGLFLVIDLGGRWYAITTHAKGEEVFYYDSDLDRIVDAFLPYLSSGDYAKAIETFFSKSEAHMRAYYTQGLPIHERYPLYAIFGVALLIGCAVGGIVVGSMIGVHKVALRKVPQAHAYLDEKGLVVTHRRDDFLYTRTTRTAIPKNTGSSGGGGGHSSHTSSSGRSHGGSSGRF